MAESLDHAVAQHRRPVYKRIFRGLMLLLEPGNRMRLLRWFAAGLAFMALNTVLLYGLVGKLKVPVVVATLLAAEACTLLRFAVNHYWVFGNRNPTWAHCVQYHIANAGAFVVWWVAANALTVLGMHYLVASIVAVACSTLVSLMTNFHWIWRRGHT
jgi:putative flippase GtrA